MIFCRQCTCFNQIAECVAKNQGAEIILNKSRTVLKNKTGYRVQAEFPGSRLRLRKFCFCRLRTAAAGLILFFPLAVFSQIRDSAVLPPPAPRTPKVDTAQTPGYSFAQAPERSWPAADTLPGRDFRLYDPTRRQTPDWGALGNLGTPARPLWFETPARRGFDTGAHGFDLYRLEADSLRFYRNVRAFSEVFFSQGPKQDDAMFTAQLGRTFSGGSTFAFAYRSFNNLGQFRYQQARHNSLSAGVWLPAGKRYDGFFIFCQNIFRQQDNGGVVTDTLFGKGQFEGPIDAEIRLPDGKAQTRFSDRVLQLTQHLKFTDSDSSSRVFRVSHTIAWTKASWKFTDAGLKSDSLFFNDFFLTDRRGLRNFISLDRLDNTFTLNTFKQKTSGRSSDVLALGLLHSWFDLHQEPLDSSFSNFFLTGELGITPSERFGLRARGELGLLDNFGEYRVSGLLSLGLGKAGQFRASVLSQRRPPALLQYRAFVSFRELWHNDFQKPLETSLSATYALPAIGLEATGRTHLVNNFIYFDQNGRPAQTGAPLQIAQLLLSENLRLGRLHFDNTVGLQQINRDDVLRLPKWFSENSLYFAGKVFKKRMDLRAGVDLRVNGDFRPDAYQPLLWQFHLQDSLSQKPYPWVDLFLAFKVRTFRFFIRYENLKAAWEPEKAFYQTARHPLPFNALRFGINWRFMDNNKSDAKTPAETPDGTPPPGGIGPRGN